MAIFFNESQINDWNYGSDNIIKVYRNNAVCYYKIDTSSPSGQTPCFAVVDDISQYSDTEFEDVFNKADEKWYKLNNLNQYEEYGIYGSGRTITYYDGKLTIDGNYEYMYSGSSWVNVGEVSGGSISDDYVIPFEDSKVKTICVNKWGGNTVVGELTYGEAKQVTSLGGAFSGNTSIISFNELAYFHGLTALTDYEFVNCSNLRDIVIPNNVTNMVKRSGVSNSYVLFKGCSNLSGLTWLSGGETLSLDLIFENNSYWMKSSHTSTPIVFPNRGMSFGSVFAYADYIRIGYFQSSTPPTGLSTSDITASQRLGTIYCPIGASAAYTAALNGLQKTVIEYDFGIDSNGILNKEKEWTSKTSSQSIYPLYYDEMQDPPNNLSFSSMAEAEAYECPWVGMQATIDGDNYIFSGDSISGYEWVEQILPYDAEIEYLESSGTQYINTNKYLNISSFEIGYDILGNWIKWGYTRQGNGAGTWIGVESSIAFFGNFDSSRVSITTSNVENVIKYVSTSGITVNGTSYSKTFAIGTDSIASIPLYLFGRYDFRANAIDFDESAKLKSFYVKNNDELVLDMIPVRVGQVGYMYDKVSGELFGNAGTGDFILGADKN